MAHANTEELIAAWSTLDELDFLILRKMGATLCPGTAYSEPLDLIHEAYARALDGRRNWPTHVRFSVFLGNAMRSIAQADRKASKRRGAGRVDFDEFMESMQHMAASPSAQDDAEDLEELRLGRAAADELRSQLEGDAVAQKVLSGLVAGLSPEEMRESFHLDAKTFNAAVARIARRARHARMH